MPKCIECKRFYVTVSQDYCDDCIESILHYLEAVEEMRNLEHAEYESTYQQQFTLFD
jgi:hypothetical protein